MRMLRLAWPIAVVTLLVLAGEGTARAQSAADSEQAERLFTEASTLATEGKYAEACPKFQESQRLDPAVGTQFNLALCYEKIGKLGSAWRNFRAVERLAHATGKKGREDAAHEKLQSMRAHVPHLVLRTKDTDATLKVDGEQVATDDYAFYAVDPGEHTVLATAPSKKPWQSSVTVPDALGGAGAEVTVEVPALMVAAGQTRVVTVTKSNPKRTLGYVVGGVGLLGLAAAGVTGIMVLDAKSTADEKCTPGCVDDEGRDAIARGRTLLPINAVAWGVGAVGVAAGAFLLLTSSPKESRSARVVPLFGPAGGGASLVGSF